jgi:hypothetical protein
MNRRGAEDARLPFYVTPAKAGVQSFKYRQLLCPWIPAFAGMTNINLRGFVV